jgi:hypothetical protein
MSTQIDMLVEFIRKYDRINDKSRLAKLVSDEFSLIKDGSVFYNDSFAIRFSQAMTTSFSNTVLAISKLQKFDSRPFFVCVVCPNFNYILISNSTFLKKVSHSSQALSLTNIKGSFNGSDILRVFNSIENRPENFTRLFLIHDSIGFQDNLPRLVDATNAIVGTGHEFSISEESRILIDDSPNRAIEFVKSVDYQVLKLELDNLVKKNNHAILIASLIQNVNIRGRAIEYLITGEDEKLREQLIQALINNQEGLPRFSTENSLGDYTKIFDSYYTETDVKTKVMFLDSNPKAYNIDKILEFLSREKSVFLFYFIGINPGKVFNTVLISMFEERLVNGTLLLKHWSGRNSRGVTQLEGRVIKDIINEPGNVINISKAVTLINKMIEA